MSTQPRPPGVLVTGHRGLIDTALTSRGVNVHGLDLRATGPSLGDVRERDRVERALDGCGHQRRGNRKRSIA